MAGAYANPYIELSKDILLTAYRSKPEVVQLPRGSRSSSEAREVWAQFGPALGHMNVTLTGHPTKIRVR